MSKIENDVLWETIQDNLEKHVESYLHIGDEEIDKELLEFIYKDKLTMDWLCNRIADTKFGQRIAEKAYDSFK